MKANEKEAWPTGYTKIALDHIKYTNSQRGQEAAIYQYCPAECDHRESPESSFPKETERTNRYSDPSGIRLTDE